MELFCGETRQLTASPTESTFSWVSEDPEIADVDVHGMVTAKSKGNTRIVVSSGDNKEYVEVDVEAPASKKRASSCRERESPIRSRHRQ